MFCHQSSFDLPPSYALRQTNNVPVGHHEAVSLSSVLTAVTLAPSTDIHHWPIQPRVLQPPTELHSPFAKEFLDHIGLKCRGAAAECRRSSFRAVSQCPHWQWRTHHWVMLAYCSLTSLVQASPPISFQLCLKPSQSASVFWPIMYSIINETAISVSVEDARCSVAVAGP